YHAIKSFALVSLMEKLILLLLLPLTTSAAIPDFKCWDIHNDSFSTDMSFYVTRYLGKMPPPYGAFHYETAPDEKFYRELVITNEAFDDGYNYGSRYLNKEGTLYDDIKCKRL
ncbi:TPA: hypothetical protein ACHUVP_004492, partial [Shigella sonnei]